MGQEHAAWRLVDVDIGGVVLRYSSQLLTVTNDAGDELEYQPGLGDDDFELSLGGDDVAVTVVDASEDWPSLAELAEGSMCTVRRWNGRDTLEQCPVYARGLVTGIEHGLRDEPVSWRVLQQETATALVGRQVPDPLAKVGEDTWPLDGNGTLQDDGYVYPVLFGTPGRDGTANGHPVMPIPLASNSGTSLGAYAVLALEPQPGIGDVYIRNDNLDSELAVTPSVVTDLLGRAVQVAEFQGAGHVLRPTSFTEQSTLFAAFPTQGGAHSTAWEVVRYLLTRWGNGTADWALMRAVQDDLAQFRVDSWINDPVSSPWEWIEGVLLRTLPYEIRTSADGRYLYRSKYLPDGTYYRMDLEDGYNAHRVAGRRLVAGYTNEFTARYRRGRDGEWLGRVIATGRDVSSKDPGIADPEASASQVVRIARDTRCLQAFSRWGLRQSEQPVDIDWTWDTGTALAVLEARIEREAVSAWESDYWVYAGHDLRPGDEVVLTDEGMSVSQPAVVAAPVVANRTEWVRATLRYAVNYDA